MIVDISVDRHGIDVGYTGTMYLKGYDSLCIAWNTISDIDFYDSTGSYAYYFDTRPNYFTECNTVFRTRSTSVLQTKHNDV